MGKYIINDEFAYLAKYNTHLSSVQTQYKINETNFEYAYSCQ